MIHLADSPSDSPSEPFQYSMVASTMYDRREAPNWEASHTGPQVVTPDCFLSSENSIMCLSRQKYLGIILMCCAKSLQICPTLWNPMDCSPPGSPVRGIFQARILEWVATPSSKGSSWPRDQTRISYVSYIDRQVLYYWHHLQSLRESSLISDFPSTLHAPPHSTSKPHHKSIHLSPSLLSLL